MISCIVPVYNGERYLGEAIESILKQNYRPIEIIIADDGSTDGTASIAARYGEQVRYLRQADSMSTLMTSFIENSSFSIGHQRRNRFDQLRTGRI